MGRELLLEIGTEEIPARFLPPVLEEMAASFRKMLEAERIGVGEILTWGTPRRLALVAREVAESQAEITQEIIGPPKAVALDAAGQPTPAATGFAKAQGVTVSAAAAGLGIIQVADYYAHPHIQRGDLMEILRAFKAEGHIISAVFPKEQPYSPKIRAFVDFLSRQFDRPPWTKREVQVVATAASADDRLVLTPNFRRAPDPPAANTARSGRARTPSASA